MKKMFNILSVVALSIVIGCNAVALDEADTIVIGESGTVSWDAPTDGGAVESYIISIGATCEEITTVTDVGDVLSFNLPIETMGPGDYCSYVQAKNTSARGVGQLGTASNQIVFSIVEDIPVPGTPTNYRLTVQ